jgi:multimeric flavodoxin WrbA
MMKIAILNGSPKIGNTAAMISAFAEGAKEAGHEVEILHVGKMKINGCLACEYCHGKGEGKCVQKDDMEKVMPAYKEADMIVYASPIYYFGMSAQLSAAIQRVYAIGKPAKAKKAALLLSSASPAPYSGAIATYKDMVAFMGLEDAGIITAAGEENGSEAKLDEIRAFAKAL